MLGEDSCEQQEWFLLRPWGEVVCVCACACMYVRTRACVCVLQKVWPVMGSAVSRVWRDQRQSLELFRVRQETMGRLEVTSTGGLRDCRARTDGDGSSLGLTGLREQLSGCHLSVWL